MIAILLFMLAWPGSALAKEQASQRLLKQTQLPVAPEPVKHPKLFDLAKAEARPVKDGRLLPHRLYLVFHETEKHWGYALTNGHGRFGEPFEVVTPGSVVAGTLLGGLYPQEHYELDKSGKWTRVEKDEFLRLLVLSDPPRRKWITYVTPRVPEKK